VSTGHRVSYEILKEADQCNFVRWQWQLLVTYSSIANFRGDVCCMAWSKQIIVSGNRMWDTTRFLLQTELHVLWIVLEKTSTKFGPVGAGYWSTIRTVNRGLNWYECVQRTVCWSNIRLKFSVSWERRTELMKYIHTYIHTYIHSYIHTTLFLQTFYIPDHVGFSLGTPEDANFFIMETHYDNPTYRDGMWAELLYWTTHMPI
jgi:hypothetical protein